MFMSENNSHSDRYTVYAEVIPARSIYFRNDI